MPLWAAAACVLACGGDPAVERPSPEVDSLAFARIEQIQIELEIVNHEIADLEAVLASDASPAPVAGTGDPHALIERGRRARDEAQRELAAGDAGALVTAMDSLTAAAGHIEAVKRALGLAEEWGF